MSIGDNRLPPFCWQSLEAVRRIQMDCAPRIRTLALALYVTLTHLAAERGRGLHQDFVAARREIAERSGMSLPTLDKHAEILTGLGLLSIERRRDESGLVDLPSRWSLAAGPTGESSLVGGSPTANLLGPYARETSGSSTTNVSKKKKESAAEPLGFDVWLEHHSMITGTKVMRLGTRIRATVARSFAKAIGEGYSVDDLKHVTAAAFQDDFRRNGGHTSPESVLRPGAIEKFVNRPLAEEAAPSRHQQQLETALAYQPTIEQLEAELAELDDRKAA